MTRAHRPTIALAGNPNSGKTTVFNALTGSRQRIGNWPGVTVERKEGTLVPRRPELAGRGRGSGFGRGRRHGATAVAGTEPAIGAATVVDLPGIYSMAAASEDEVIARDFLLSGGVDLVVNIVDASNIERNLFLTLQLIEMRLPVLVVLNMMDLAAQKGIRIDVHHLSQHLGCPVVPVSAVRPEQARSLLEAIGEHLDHSTPSTMEISYPQPIERAIETLIPQVETLGSILRAEPRWVAVKIIEGDPWVRRRFLETTSVNAPELATLLAQVSHELREELDVAIADARYGLIHGLSAHVTRERMTRQSATERLDRIVLNRVIALPIFFAVMYGVFWFTMAIGGAFIDFFDIAFGTLVVDGFGALLASMGSPSWLTIILADGIGTGIQTVATFVPIIFAMFLALSLLEDSGYMARAAYVMDRFMRTIGLPGKSFVPMMVGFGCTVPAIMSTRTLETRRDRFITIFMAPNMSCGARLPVYALFAAAFFAERSGTIVFSLYFIGILIAALTGLLLKTTLFRGEPSHFVMELPPYHAPRPRYVLSQAWVRLKAFVVRAGVTITLIVTVLSLLNSFAVLGDTREEESLLSGIGKAITPVFRPLGIEDANWPATVGLFTGIFAKEAVVGTLNALYSQDAGDEHEWTGILDGLREALATIPENLAGIGNALGDPLGLQMIASGESELAEEVGADVGLFARLRGYFTPASAYAYLLFVLVYFPCAAALAAAIREMGALLGWILGAYSTLIAWSVATLYYQFATGPDPLYVAIAVVLIAAAAVAFRILGATKFRPQALEAK